MDSEEDTLRQVLDLIDRLGPESLLMVQNATVAARRRRGLRVVRAEPAVLPFAGGPVSVIEGSD